MPSIIEIITDKQLHLFLLPFKVLSVVFTLAGLIFLAYVYHHRRWMRFGIKQNITEWLSQRPYEAVQFERNWEEIKKRLEKGWESEDKLAVIEADKLLDDFLKRMGYKGESLGERLKQLDKEIMPNLDRLWDAHNIRGDIVHDPGCRLDHKKAKEVIDIYEQAFDHLREV